MPALRVRPQLLGRLPFSRWHSRRRTYATVNVEGLEIYDVVCVGGGPAGLSLLSAIRQSPITSNLRVALVESQDLSKTRTWSMGENEYSNRVSSLTPSSVAYLRDIGIWKHLQLQRVQPYEEMQVWDGVSGSRISFDWTGGEPQRTSENTIAYMNENLNLVSGCLSRLEELGGLDIFDKSPVEMITYGPQTGEVDLTGWPVVKLASGKQLAARLLVGADGSNSPVRTFAGIQSRGWDYNRHGVVATLQLDPNGPQPHFKTAYQRFLPSGPVAMLPLPGNFATLVWSTLPQYASLLKSLNPQDFTAMVNAAFRLSPTDLAYLHTMSSGQAEEIAWREQNTSVPDERIPQRVVGVQQGTVQNFPLKMRHADTYVAPRIALVGDAAHTVHPLAGQGLNQGQGDIQSLAKVIEATVACGEDIGSLIPLEQYNAERYATNNLLMGVVDKLHKLYASTSTPVVALRSLGLDAVNALNPVKQFFMKQASGQGVFTSATKIFTK